MDKRVKWLDAAKGLGILWVVLGHTMPGAMKETNEAIYWVATLIYYFHMPYLVFLSGYAFQISQKRYERETVLAFIKRKGRALLVPYFSYGLLIYLVFLAASSVPFLRPIMESAGYGPIPLARWLGGFALGSNDYCQHLWYLYALFIYSVLCFLILRMAGDRKRLCNALLLLAAGAFLAAFYGCAWAKRIGTNSVTFYFYWFVMGWKLKLPAWKRGKACGILAVSLALYVCFFRMERLFLDTPLWFVVHTLTKALIVLGMICLVRGLYVEEKKRWTGLLRFFLWSGKHSMEIYLFSQPFFGAALSSLLYMTGRIPVPFILCISMALSIVIPVGAAEILKRNGLAKRLFGLKEKQI